jgi:hypothetical protein
LISWVECVGDYQEDLEPKQGGRENYEIDSKGGEVELTFDGGEDGK